MEQIQVQPEQEVILERSIGNHFEELLEKKGHKVFWVSSKKDISFQLLKLYGIDFTEIIKLIFN